jgi:hypothetical protein
MCSLEKPKELTARQMRAAAEEQDIRNEIMEERI